MEEKVFFEGELGKICGVLHSVNNKDEIVILVHGLGANKETSAKINSVELNKIGINALRIDLDNRGESDLDFGTKACISNYVKQVKAAIKFVKEKGFKEVSLLGTSFGGIVVLSTALRNPDIKRIFLRAPSLDYQKELLNDFGETKLNEFKETGLISYDGELFFSFNCYEDAKDYSMPEHASKIKQPIMIIQGDNDKEIDYKFVQEVGKLFPNAKLHIIKGADHGLGVNNNWDEGKEAMIDFFSD